MRCLACNKVLNHSDLYIDDELCQKCLVSIKDSLRPEVLDKIETYGDLEDNE